MRKEEDDDDEDEDLARAIAMSMEKTVEVDDNVRKFQELTGVSEQEATTFLRSANDNLDAAMGLYFDDKSMKKKCTVMMKKIDADNSCLFNSIGFCIDKKLDAKKYRNVVAREIAINKDGQWTSSVLGKPAHVYVRWIRDPKKWGGEIEMSILSKHLEVEIAAFSVQTCRMTLYGKGFKKRIYLLYSGIHYDAVVDQSENGTFASNDVHVLNAVESLVEELHKKHQFINLSEFKLICMVCRKELRGQKDAALHAKETGHSQFGEIS